MRKYYCDCCKKEIPRYEQIHSRWIKVKRYGNYYDLCPKCDRQYEDFKVKTLDEATKEFFKKKGLIDIPEDENGSNE